MQLQNVGDTVELSLTVWKWGGRTCYGAGASALFFAYFLLYLSTRPAESTSFCRPVKNGWQAEQISIFRFPIVERVSNVLPQTQVTIDFL